MFERRTDQIRFLAVADAERIVADADRLAMSQSALSRTVIAPGKALERRMP